MMYDGASASCRGIRSERFRGFTLIEVLVVASLFIVLFGTLGGIHFTFVNKNRDLLVEQAMQRDVQNFFEVLDREVRTGFGVTFSGYDSPSAGLYRAFALKNQNGVCVKYDVSGTTLYRSISSDASCDPTNASQSYPSRTRMTSTKSVIQQLLFSSVQKPTVDTQGNANPADDLLAGLQGRATVSLLACPTRGGTPRCMRVQTTMTSRQHATSAP